MIRPFDNAIRLARLIKHVLENYEEMINVCDGKKFWNFDNFSFKFLEPDR